MPLTDPAPGRSSEEAPGPPGVLVSLCVTQVVGWGTVYYSFPVLSGVIGAETGWPATGTAAAFTAALVASAAAGVPVGRRLDRHGPRGLMTAASVLAGAAMALVGWAPTLAWFTAAWVLAGLAMSGTLYPPAFAALTRWYGPRRVQALTVLTLTGGLASTLFAPITALLADRLGWRAAYFILAAVVTLVAVPIHWWGLAHPWPPAAPPVDVTRHPGRVLRSREFLALAVALSLAACASYAVVVNLVPLLTERGLGITAAATVLGVGGAAQLLGRLGYPALSRTLPVRTRTAAVLAGVAGTVAVLAVVTSSVAVVVVVVIAGALRGIVTLLHATAVTDRWGSSHYGHLSGLLSAPVAVAAALAPWLSAILAAALGGYAPMLLVLAVMSAAAVGAALVSVPADASTP